MWTGGKRVHDMSQTERGAAMHEFVEQAGVLESGIDPSRAAPVRLSVMVRKPAGAPADSHDRAVARTLEFDASR